jgi:hypothetical protein
MNLSINELSLDSEEIRDSNRQRHVMNEFAELLHRLWSVNKQFPAIFTSSEFYASKIVIEWREHKLTEMKYVRLFNTFLSNRKNNIIKTADYSDAEFLVSVVDTLKNSLGCLVAHEEGMSTISLKTHCVWHDGVIKGCYRKLDSKSGALSEDEVCVENISDIYHVEKYIKKQEDAFFASINTAQDLWENREDIFPGLVFCEGVKSQIQRDDDKQHISGIITRLKLLNDYTISCEGAFTRKKFGHGARDESDYVKSNKKLSEMRKFQKPCGDRVYFYEHYGFSTTLYSGGRIHYLYCNDQKKCYVGYIGRHLPTQNF